MAACGGLEHIFEKPLPPWKSIDHHSFTEIFAQKDNNNNNNYLLHHSSTSLSSSLSSNSDRNDDINDHPKQKQMHHKRNDSFSSMNSECMSTCTEELNDDNDLLNNHNYYNDSKPKKSADYEKYWGESKRYSTKNFGAVPPPISSLGRNGKPWVFFKSIRKDGRFILKEIRIPTQEFLHACRKNGRLKMHFIHSDDEIMDEDEEDDENEDEI